jgi:hypothetical protein
VKRVGSKRFKGFLLALSIFAGLLPTLQMESASANNIVQDACQIGSSSTCPAQSPQEIVNLYGTNTNAAYWINVNGTARETFLILNSGYPDSGGWFLGMKGTRAGTSFWYNSSQWTDSTTVLNTSSLSDDVSTEAKFHAFNNLPVTRLVAVFKDRALNAFDTNGSGALGPNSFGGHTWSENVTSTTMFTRFTTNSNIIDGSGYPGDDGSRYAGRFAIHRETNASNGKLVFPYQTGWTRYGFNNTTGYSYRWGTTSNNEGSMGSNDSGSGIGLDANSASAIVSYSDNLTVGPNGTSGVTNPGTLNYPSGFQIWGRMANPSIATPATLTRTNISAGSIRLNIGAVAAASEYAIQYKLSATSTWSSATTLRLTSPNASTPSATISGLATGTYDFRVWSRATNNSSATARSLLNESVDVTAPSFTSTSTFSAAENIATSANAATIKVSESATVTSSAGADTALFNIVTSDSVTAFVRFKASPNFEAPSDGDTNNIYEITLTATDSSGNAGTQSITITVTDVVDTSSFNSLSISGSATFRQVVTITANVTVASRVTFRARNVVIAGCKNKIASGSGSSFSASCTWRPSTRGAVTLTATATPTGAGISPTTATPISVMVRNRSGGR